MEMREILQQTEKSYDFCVAAGDFLLASSLLKSFCSHQEVTEKLSSFLICRFVYFYSVILSVYVSFPVTLLDLIFFSYVFIVTSTQVNSQCSGIVHTVIFCIQ